MSTEQLVTSITNAVLQQLAGEQNSSANTSEVIPVGVSNRHVHLAQSDAEKLFGEGANLTLFKNLSQPGQFACNEKVIIAGPKGVIEGVRILGPFRKTTQVEIAPSDAVKLGIKPPVRDSGDIEDSPGIVLIGPAGVVALSKGVIIAARHIHMHPSDAQRFGVKDKQRICVRARGPRALIFHKVLIRVSDQFALEMHIDIDEANAGGVANGDKVEIVR